MWSYSISQEHHLAVVTAMRASMLIFSDASVPRVVVIQELEQIAEMAKTLAAGVR